MHELSIAQNIIEIIRQSVPPENLNNVKAVKVKVGEVSGVVPESLEFSFQAITSETDLYQAYLEIEKIPFVIKCNVCMKESNNEFGMRICGFCGSNNVEVISGTELYVIELELQSKVEENV